MCLRYALTMTDSKAIASRFGLTDVPKLKPRYNIAPTQEVPVVFNDSTDRLSFARWGMPANWSGARHPLFNARAESVDKKSSFRKDFELRRCLMLADSFYEWKHPTKRPFRMFLKNGGMFAFAGIYADAPDSDIKKRTCCMITTEANYLVAQIHNRMPMILDEGTEKDWLKADPGEAKGFLSPYPADEMDIYEVSSKVNSAKNDSKELLERKTTKGT
ncbi:MAG: SOS response-associated peptidase, partial [Candidatus Micrarchaeota archaeon]